MPLLDAAQVRYFNPQVDEWFDELVQIETRAKETAQIMFVVVDKLTRCLVSINEAVEFICRGRKVMLVVDDIDEAAEVAGKTLEPTELADLNGARQCLRDLAIKRGVGLYPDVETAVQASIEWLTQVNLPKSRPEVPRLRKRSSIVLNDWSGKHRPHRVTSRSHSSRLLKSARGAVYLGGNLTATSWRQKVAIPLLRTAGIPIYVPFADYLSFGLSSAAEKHVQALAEHWQEIATQKAIAELILFVIPSNLRSIAAMTEAVELVSSHQALLLVIESVTEGCMQEDGVVITGREFKDLARARVYLREMAERNDVHVFESVTEAVESIVERLE
ncbi:hypothetical protein BBO99_00007661 [Phytophthora kernoviae]|uniref:Uncharacterized protein n=2 Tax=Phytophthora kernoviae TaxID=325452 RepID=A0A3R7J478_9STRA|nr:hypothetical protein G195_009798 [Phytophthora kernoviae 00238/432]KAG2511731.1 hypothetical protein JM16_008147 [Phytophthora kernoviae]KAG2515752.1 hypothetical protein JM18_008114 [Phytophthora kernoviae]RLN10737.1 hypothetical protein BBI17_007179 [Phytophthora kernoviae]RLN76305.1 hypothetical protein BBO99_00007661 [Phytophthora kernoviae]